MNNNRFEYYNVHSIGKLIRNIAHSYNNLITGIIGYSDLLEDNDESGIAKSVMKAAEKAQSLTTELSCLGRKLTDCPHRANLNESLKNREDFFKKIVGESLTVNFVLKEGQEISINCDQELFYDVLFRFLLSIKDICKSGCEVRISTDKSQTQKTEGELAIALPESEYGVISFIGQSDLSEDELKKKCAIRCDLLSGESINDLSFRSTLGLLKYLNACYDYTLRDKNEILLVLYFPLFPVEKEIKPDPIEPVASNE
ncbi:MAG: hypothetical protein GF315_10100 [candidate division Zixibacteria bacterium]|nr:hypothetical protein [candidate division Zixibacteria bacterium]